MAGTLVIGTLSDGTNSTSTTNAIQGSAKAWVNFNGQGTGSIRASYNVSSITRNNTALYTLNFTNALVDTNYAWCGSARIGWDSTASYLPSICAWLSDTKTTSALQIRGYMSNNGLPYSGTDFPEINISVFR